MTPKHKKNVKDGRRWRRRKDARPGEIRRAALECFGERGFAGTRLDDVAERAGVTKGTLYLYFQNKEDLFKAVVSEELVPNIVRIGSQIADMDLTPPEALAQLMRLWVRTLTATRLSLMPKIVISEVGNFPDLAEFYVREVIDRGVSLVGGIIRRGIESGHFREVDVEETTVCVIAPAIVSMLWKHTFELHGSRTIDPESLLETHIEMILRGLQDQAAVS
jgi:AcrR family transcriptional regulator